MRRLRGPRAPFSPRTRPQHPPLPSTQVNLSRLPQPAPPTGPDSARPGHGLRVRADHRTSPTSWPPPPHRRRDGSGRCSAAGAGWLPHYGARGAGPSVLVAMASAQIQLCSDPKVTLTLGASGSSSANWEQKPRLVPQEGPVKEAVRAGQHPAGWVSGCRPPGLTPRPAPGPAPPSPLSRSAAQPRTAPASEPRWPRPACRVDASVPACREGLPPTSVP